MTTYKQTIQPNLSLTDVTVPGEGVLKTWVGWCLAVTRSVFDIPAINGYANAIDSWNKSKTKHADYNPPEGVYVPLYWSGGTAHGVDNTGHITVALRKGDQITIWTVPLKKSTKFVVYTGKIGATIDKITKDYGMTKYLGWTCDINGRTVAEKASEAGEYVFAYPTASGGNASFTVAPDALDSIWPKLKARVEKMSAGDIVQIGVRAK